MKRIDADIDIDVPDRDSALNAIGDYVVASQINNDTIKPHNVGVYLQEIPKFLDTRWSSIDYKEAPNYGFFKIDIITNNVYSEINNEKELDILINADPDWRLLQNKDVVQKLSQVHNYYERLLYWKPKNVLELAAFIAMIRPSKSHLMECDNWNDVFNEIWNNPRNGQAYFKKSHAIAYAVSIVVQLNLYQIGRL